MRAHENHYCLININKTDLGKYMDTSLPAILFLALGLGLLHALDADHILAVSGLSGGRASLKSAFYFCRHWAIGHAATLLLIGTLVFILGKSMPVQLSQHAEHFVAVVLIAIGAYILFNLRYSDSGSTPLSRLSATGALFVGTLHGLAGSAPLLAVIPIARLDSPWHAFLYLLVFSLGVLMAMLMFGGCLNGIYRVLLHKHKIMLKLLRALIAVSSIGFGIFMLVRI